MKQRVYYLDVIRCMACLMVILMHAPLPDGTVPGFYHVLIYTATSPCIGLFFMISGALLLPARDSGLVFLKKRLGKVIAPTIVWTIVAIIIRSFSQGWSEPKEMLRILCSIPFSVQVNPVLWFMYVLIGLYVITPVISPWIEKASRNEMRTYLALWMVAMSYPIISLWLKIETSPKGILYYCSGYVGYYVLGYYLRKYGAGSNFIAILLLPIPFFGVWAYKYFEWNIDYHEVFWYLSILCALMCWCWFTLIKNQELPITQWSERVHDAFAMFSNLSFGIYLAHLTIMRDFLWPLIAHFHIDGWTALSISFFGTVILSYLLAVVISRVRCGQYIIGYTRAKN